MDQDCVHFLQWALPQLEMQWVGFRKVRKQVCKRIQRRMHHLGLSDFPAYRKFLETNQGEWEALDNFCRITISRFYRDQRLFDYLGLHALPEFMRSYGHLDQYTFLSLGCASGEEPYTLAILWHEAVRTHFPGKRLKIIGLDIDPALLERAKHGRYASSSLRELPDAWRARAFSRENELFALKEEYRHMVEFIQADVRKHRFDGDYHLVCCRNLVATYYSPALQVLIFRKLRETMPEGAILILGTHEELPEAVTGFEQDGVIRQLYRVVAH